MTPEQHLAEIERLEKYLKDPGASRETAHRSAQAQTDLETHKAALKKQLDL